MDVDPSLLWKRQSISAILTQFLARLVNLLLMTGCRQNTKLKVSFSCSTNEFGYRCLEFNDVIFDKLKWLDNINHFLAWETVTLILFCDWLPINIAMATTKLVWLGHKAEFNAGIRRAINIQQSNIQAAQLDFQHPHTSCWLKSAQISRSSNYRHRYAKVCLRSENEGRNSVARIGLYN